MDVYERRKRALAVGGGYLYRLQYACMLPFYIAAALFADTFGRPPRKREHAALLEAVREVYRHIRRAPSPDPAEALQQLRASARVREVLDVAVEGPELTAPHSFVLHSEELEATARKHRTCVIENVGCLVFHKRSFYLVTETQVKRVLLHDVFAKRRPCRSVIVLEAV